MPAPPPVLGAGCYTTATWYSALPCVPSTQGSLLRARMRGEDEDEHDWWQQRMATPLDATPRAAMPCEAAMSSAAGGATAVAAAEEASRVQGLVSGKSEMTLGLRDDGGDDDDDDEHMLWQQAAYGGDSPRSSY